MNRRSGWNRGVLSLGVVVSLWAFLCVLRPVEAVRAQDAAKTEKGAAAPAPAAAGAPAANEAESKPAESKSVLWWLIETSGWIGAVLLVLSIYFVAKVVHMFSALRLEVAAPTEILQQCENLLKAKDFMGVYKLVKGDDSFFSTVLTAGLAELPQGLAEARDAMERVGETLEPRDRTRLEAIADAGAIAVGVNTMTYLRNLSHAEPGCLLLFRDAETLGRQLQREHPTTQYRVPIVAGEGIGGALASRIVAQSPLQTVGGAVAVDPSTTLPLDREICTRPLEADDREASGTLDAPVLKNPWTVALTPAASPEMRARFAALAERTKLMTLRDLPDAADALAFADLIRRFLPPDRPQTVGDLPLVELPAVNHTRRMAVFLSGDAGWRDFDKRILRAAAGTRRLRGRMGLSALLLEAQDARSGCRGSRFRHRYI